MSKLKIDEYSIVEIRKFNNGTRCKICDNIVSEGLYLKSFRTNNPVFHICFDCVDGLINMVSEYKKSKDLR